MKGTWQTTGGGGGGEGLLIVVVAVVAALVLGSAGKAASAAGPVLGEAVKIAAITVGCVLGAAVAVAVAWTAVRARRALRARRTAAARVLSCPHCQGLAAPPMAIGARHPVIPGVVVDDAVKEVRRP